MSNIQCFTIQEIPNATLQKFKICSRLWRILGKNANSAIMCSIIHFYLSTDPKQLLQLISQVKPKIQSAFTFYNYLITSIQSQKPLLNFFDNLRQQDSQNYLAGQYLEYYLKQKGIQHTKLDNFLEKVAIEFGIQFQAYNQLGNAKFYGKEEKNLIILYDSGSCWYHILIEEQKLGSSSLKEQNSLKECLNCHRSNLLLNNPRCRHSICIDCLKRNFQSGQVTRIKCPISSCKLWIDRGDYLEMIQLEQKQKSLQIAAQQSQSTKAQKQENKEFCDKCFKQTEIGDLYLHSECSKYLCKACISSRYNNKEYLNKPENIKCFSCHKQLDLKDLKIFLNISDKQESPKKVEATCENCIKVTAQQDLFENPSCKHKFCRNCLKYFKKNNSSNFLCLKINCQAHLYRSEIEKFLQKPSSPIKQNNYFNKASNQVSCSKCRQYCKKEEVYNNYCGHSYCQSCADQEIVKGKLYFFCHSPSCSEQIIVEDVQQYFYNQLLDKNKRSCNLCLETYIPSSMFKNHKCDHYLCYNCVNKIAQKQQFHVTCPVKKCFAYINADELDTYFTDKQEEILKEQLKLEEEDLKIKQEEQQLKQQQQQQQQQHPSLTQSEIQNESNLTEDEMVRIAIESSLKNSKQQKQESKIERSVGISDNKLSQIIKAQAQEAQKKLIEDPPQDDQATENMEIEANNESKITQILKQNIEDIEGNCTFCRFPFSDFNLPQQLDCKKHRIGVCCLRYGIQCSQCNYQEIKQKEQSKTKKKFKIFQEESYYPQSPQLVSREAEDAKPNSRLSSRIYAQPLQQRSLLYQSQGLYPSTQAMRNASVGYALHGLGRRY